MSVRTTRSAALRIAAGCVMMAAALAAGAAENEPGSRHSEELRRTTALIHGELPRWKVAMGTDQLDLKLDPKPILRWTNPATGRLHGEVFVWTADGRPECVMSLYKGWEPAWGFCGELQSLSLTRLVAERNQFIAWKSNEAGITLRDVPDGSAVGETAPRRLRQMHAMAREFTAVLMDYRKNAEGERQALRLLTSPVYRFSSPERGVADGAMFAFVLGTDAEVFLLLEARGAEKENRWQYALARLNSDELAAFWKEKEVWRVGKATYNVRDKPYAFMTLPETP